MSNQGLSEVLFKKVDEYVDSLAPQIQPRITDELELFQNKTIDSLETQVIDAFRSLFKKDNQGDGSRGPWNQDVSVPDSYGGLSLPFADEIASLTRNFNKISDEAGDDIRDIFDLTENCGGGNGSRGQEPNFSGGAKGFLSSAINAVQDHLEKNNAGGLELPGLLGTLSDTIKDASRNLEEKARLISPEIKDAVGEKLRAQHAPIAEQFTRLALDHIKRWLRGNTSSRDLGDGAKAEIEDQVKDLVKGIGGLFGSKRSNNDESSRGFDESDRSQESGGGGFQKVLSDKLSTGLAKVHREVRLEFRKILGEIEKQLFELLPDQFQRPLEKILGGNPFDSQLDRDAGGQQVERGFGDDIKAKLLNKIRALVSKVQETLRESILGVVNGGHRKFERESWVFVQNMVEQKIQRYLPDVKINVPDDIGNEGVSVGAPVSNAQLGGGAMSAQGGGHEQSQQPPRRDDYQSQQPPRRDDYQSQQPPRYDEYHSQDSPRRDDYQSQSRPNDYNDNSQNHRDDQYNRSNEHYDSYNSSSQHRQDQGYRNDSNQQNQRYQAPPQQHNQDQGYPPPNQTYHQQGYPPQQGGYQQGYNQGQQENDYSQQNYQPRY